MAPPVVQPTLPAEGAYGDLEQLFIAEQPIRLWPENQNSNLGAVRKVLVSTLQEALIDINEMLLELFIATADGYLSQWEELVGLPKSPSTKTVDERRTLVFGRNAKQPFTRTRRKDIVEKHIMATFGSAPAFTPDGLTLDASGISLFSDTTSLVGTYNIVENISNFSYDVRILNTITVDSVSLTRELTKITPAGISFTITFTATP